MAWLDPRHVVEHLRRQSHYAFEAKSCYKGVYKCMHASTQEAYILRKYTSLVIPSFTYEELVSFVYKRASHQELHMASSRRVWGELLRAFNVLPEPSYIDAQLRQASHTREEPHVDQFIFNHGEVMHAIKTGLSSLSAARPTSAPAPAPAPAMQHRRLLKGSGPRTQRVLEGSVLNPLEVL